MILYKVIQDNSVVDIGRDFLQWNEKHGMYFYCDVDYAQLAQGLFTGVLFHDEWLKVPPYGEYAEANIVTINEVEFDELYELLGEGEDIPVPVDPDPIPPEPIPDPDQNPDEDDDRPMTIAEMREKIQRLEESLDIIMGVIE